VPLFTESATENIPPAERSTVASRRKTCETSSKCSFSLARVKRWGKSPPLRWQHRRHGKPRVVQGQIGGESRPGSLRALAQSTASRRPLQRARSLDDGASHRWEQPSGRLLESQRELRPRGMITVAMPSLRGSTPHRIRLTWLARYLTFYES